MKTVKKMDTFETLYYLIIGKERLVEESATKEIKQYSEKISKKICSLIDIDDLDKYLSQLEVLITSDVEKRFYRYKNILNFLDFEDKDKMKKYLTYLKSSQEFGSWFLYSLNTFYNIIPELTDKMPSPEEALNMVLERSIKTNEDLNLYQKLENRIKTFLDIVVYNTADMYSFANSETVYPVDYGKLNMSFKNPLQDNFQIKFIEYQNKDLLLLFRSKNEIKDRKVILYVADKVENKEIRLCDVNSVLPEEEKQIPIDNREDFTPRKLKNNPNYILIAEIKE